MKISAGILFVLNDEKVLLVHAIHASWWNSYGPPKGHVEENESFINAAIRETKEEIGIMVDPDNLSEEFDVCYASKSGKKYKIVKLFVYRISSLQEIGLIDDVLPTTMLQKEEIDHAKFMNLEEASKKVLPRYLIYIQKYIK